MLLMTLNYRALVNSMISRQTQYSVCRRDIPESGLFMGTAFGTRDIGISLSDRFPRSYVALWLRKAKHNFLGLISG